MIENKEKIACSVGILTLNSGKGLKRCLESLIAFDEIVIADGNSTDDTLNIAREFGVKVIRQYDTEEPNIPCVKDKARVRQRNMEATRNEWYFFMDADDTLSGEVVDEIRKIVNLGKESFLAYRMPSRIFIDGREIKYEATYPSYQIRLFNKKSGARFKGDVHDHVVFDSDITIGTLKNYYDFHWSRERVSSLWRYFRNYADWEIETTFRKDLLSYLNWSVYRRFRTILGYLLYRLPKMYLLHGFKETMPLWIELTIVRYHLRIFWGEFKKFINTRRTLVYLREIFKGKDMNRILCNLAVRGRVCAGEVLDIGSGEGASHYRFLDMSKWSKILRVDVNSKANPDILMNIETEELPFPEWKFDQVMMFNVLEHIDLREKVVSEINRVLKKGGVLLGVIPFLVNVHPDPYDFARLTKQGMKSLFSKCGFSNISISEVGKGPFLASYYQVEFMIPRVIRIFVLPIVLALDGIITFLRPNLRSKFPLSYVFYITK